MLNGRTILLELLCVLFLASTVLGQNVEVLKAELKGMEGRLDAKIDGVKNELNTKIEGMEGRFDAKISGTKNELTASINGVESEVTTIKWIIGGIGAACAIFLGFLGYLLNYFVKQLLPSMVQPESRSTGQTEIGQPQREPTSGEGFTDNVQPDYQTAGGES